MTKICILTSVHSPFDTRIFHKEAKALAKAGYDVTIIAQHDKDEIVDGIRVVPLPKPGNRAERMTKTVWATYRKAIEVDANIYHFHDPELITIGLLLKCRGKRVIYDVHEDYAKSIAFRPYLPAALRIPIAALFSQAEKLFSWFFDAIVTATDDIKKHFPDQKTVAVRNYPIWEGRHKSASNENPADLSFIYIGSLTKANGITEIIRAMEHVKLSNSSKLVLAGKFSPPEYEQELRGLRGFEKVDYKGWVSFAEVPGLLASSDAGMVCCHPEPNSINSLPNKMFEYMSAGLPVIASDFPLWNEIVEKTYCGLCVDPEKPDQIAHAMNFIIDNPDVKRRMGENGRRAVEDTYNWEKEAVSLLNLYGRVIHQ
jgi:glycosyltransferase involved in cell wall biosynthesis